MHFTAAFAKVPGINLTAEPSECQSIDWFQTLLLDVGGADQQDLIIKASNDAGFMTRPASILRDQMTSFRECSCMKFHISQFLT